MRDEVIESISVPGAPRIVLDAAGEGELVFFLHGIGGNRSNWRDQVTALSSHFRTVAWDARGWGGSDDYEGPLDFADFSADLERVLDYLGAEAAHLVGLSMGGFIAQDFYARRPSRVRSLVLADTSKGMLAEHGPAWIENFLALRRKPLLEGKSPRDIAPEVVKSLAGPRAGPAVLHRLEESIAALRRDSYLKAMETVSRYVIPLDYGSVRVPTLVISGADDRLIEPQASQRLADAIPGARFAVIPDAGHLSNIEQPEAFNRLVLDFLRTR